MQPRNAATVVLVLEDELLVCFDISEALRVAGCTVYATSTAEDAIEYVRSGRRIDVVFTDIEVAGPLTGWDAAEQIRGIRSDVRVIYTSGNPGDRTRSVPDSCFFDKPYDSDEVVAACCG